MSTEKMSSNHMGYQRKTFVFAAGNVCVCARRAVYGCGRKEGGSWVENEKNASGS